MPGALPIGINDLSDTGSIYLTLVASSFQDGKASYRHWKKYLSPAVNLVSEKTAAATDLPRFSLAILPTTYPKRSLTSSNGIVQAV